MLMYASPALALQSKQINELNACWNNVISRIVGYHRWEFVKAVIYELGRLNVTYEIIVRKLKFYKGLYFNSGFLHDVFWAALLSDRSDDCLISVFSPLHVAIDSVHSRFLANVNSRSRSLYAIARPPVCHLSSVCLSSVCNVRAPYSGS